MNEQEKLLNDPFGEKISEKKERKILRRIYRAQDFFGFEWSDLDLTPEEEKQEKEEFDRLLKDKKNIKYG